MFRKSSLAINAVMVILSGFFIACSADAALETQLLVNGAPSTYNVPYLQTQ